IISILISVVPPPPIILSFTPPPGETHMSGRTALERFMSWMMVVAIAWLLWLYEFIPGVPVAALFGFTVLGLAGDLVVPRPLPLYSQGGFAIARFTDGFGTFFGHVYTAIENFLVWLAS